MSANFTAMVPGNWMLGLRADVVPTENIMKLNWLRLRFSESLAKDSLISPVRGCRKFLHLHEQRCQILLKHNAVSGWHGFCSTNQ